VGDRQIHGQAVGRDTLGHSKVGEVGNRMVTLGELRERELPVCPPFSLHFPEVVLP
jgi:hypothetical protein